jgi:hypothetical protein
MRYLIGLTLVGALALAAPSDSRAQFVLSVGSPYGYGYSGGLGYGYGYGPTIGYAPALGYTSYSSAYSGLGLGVAPLGGVGVYSSGYYGAPAVYGATVPVYPTIGYGGFGYGYGYGYRPGFYRPYGRFYRRW